MVSKSLSERLLSNLGYIVFERFYQKSLRNLYMSFMSTEQGQKHDYPLLTQIAGQGFSNDGTIPIINTANEQVVTKI